MVDRVQINVTTYMPLDGQWQIVLPGTVIDTKDATVFPSAIKLSPAEMAGALVNNTHTTVRNKRTGA